MPVLATIKLRDMNGMVHVISLEAANLCTLIKDMLDDDPDTDTDTEIPIPNIDNVTLARVITFLERHKDVNTALPVIEKPITTSVMADMVPSWYAEFVALDHDIKTLFDLTLAANYLDCASLLDLCVVKIASMIKDKTPEEIRAMFGLRDDLSDDEFYELKRANRWVFELGGWVEPLK